MQYRLLTTYYSCPALHNLKMTLECNGAAFRLICAQALLHLKNNKIHRVFRLQNTNLTSDQSSSFK